MKIFNKENGKEKVYVQMNDLMMLNQSDMPIPASIFEKVFSGIVIVDDSNRMDFVEFNEPREIEFFKSIDWIVDYKELRKLSDDELEEKAQKTAQELNAVAEKYNSMSVDERNHNQDLLMKHELLNYKIQYYGEIYNLKKGNKTMPIPDVPDSDGFSFLTDDEYCKYDIRASLDNKKLLLYRKDGKEITREEEVPYNYITTAISLFLLEKKDKDEIGESGEIDRENYLSKDNKYVVMDFTIRNKVTESSPVTEETQYTKENTIKKLLKKVFRRNKDQ